MRRLLALSLLSSCSLLFDPSKVPTSDCPASPRRCPEVPNATATCMEASCSFTCATGFRDADGVAENGCEASCATLPAPATLKATSVDDGTSLEWEFPTVPAATGYRLCTSVSVGAPACIAVELQRCGADRCSITSMGHPNRVAVFGQVQTVDACAGLTPEAQSTRAQGFTVRTVDFQPWTGAGCSPTVTQAGDVLSVEQGFCQSWSTEREETWRSGTFEVELRPSDLANNIAGGFVFTSGARRIAIVMSAERAPSGEGSLLVRESRSNSVFWRTLATSGAFLPTGVFTRLRVQQRGGVWSVSVGRPGALTEVLRYRDDELAGAPFSVGLHALGLSLLGGLGRMDFQRLSVSPEATLPPAGEVSRTLRFAPSGPVPLARVTGSNVVRYEPCPGFPAAAGCSRCAPPTSTTCARIVKFLGAGTLTADVPPGLDPTRPWSLSMRLAPPADAGFPNGTFLGVPSGNLAEGLGDGGILGLGGEWVGASATKDTWHLLELSFDPASNRFTPRWDERTITTPNTRFPPVGVSPFFGAFIVGGANLDAVDFWVSDLTLQQP